jgi:transposase
VELVWRKRTWRCTASACYQGVFTEQDDTLARPRALLTVQAREWAIGQLRREHASVRGLTQQLGTSWAEGLELGRGAVAAMAADPARFAGVTDLGVPERIWRHVSTKPEADGGRGPKELTRVVHLTRDAHGKGQTRLLDLVPERAPSGSSGPAKRPVCPC